MFKISPTIIHLYSFYGNTIGKMLMMAGFSDPEINNSALTAGDPYAGAGIFGIRGVKLIKKLLFNFSKLMNFISCKKIFLAPSLVIFARKRSFK